MIPSIFLGLIQSQIGTPDHIFDHFVIWRIFYFSNANAEGDCQPAAFRFKMGEDLDTPEDSTLDEALLDDLLAEDAEAVVEPTFWDTFPVWQALGAVLVLAVVPRMIEIGRAHV